jgi:hypothetical protein
MEHLYMDGYIKKDKLGQALHHAKINGHLAGVEDREIRGFLEGFEKVTAQRHGHFQDRISSGEMREIVNIMSRDHSDIVNERDLQTIAGVLLNKGLEF